MEKGSVSVDYERKRREYAQQTGDIRKGIGMAAFWYNTGVWPISLETSSCRMVMNQDGSIPVSYTHLDVYKRQAFVSGILYGRADRIGGNL